MEHFSRFLSEGQAAKDISFTYPIFHDPAAIEIFPPPSHSSQWILGDKNKLLSLLARTT